MKKMLIFAFAINKGIAMILVFGGTTEGRRAVAALEEAGTTYYYSTRGDAQEVELVHGQRMTGAMEMLDIVGFCREHGIRLIVDAAHPFAEELHRNLLYAAKHAGASIIRFERLYPPHTDDITWCRDYEEAIRQMEAQGIGRLLALTGVQTIGRLRPYWQRHECWCRILDRRFSQMLARKSQFPEDHLVYYEHDDTATLLERLRPQAILTKESGISGGFCEKVEAARKAGVKVFVVERPKYPPHTPIPQPVHIETVDGEHGLRRAVERLLPEFYPLKSGLTTGTCATAAALAATIRLLSGQEPAEVSVTLPNGEHISVPVGYGDGYAYCLKEAGDDPDVTNGVEIRAEVKPNPSPEEGSLVSITGGEGVGRFTLPGFDYPPGEAAINKGPREMIRKNVEELMPHTAAVAQSLNVTISVPRGEEIARRTFNPRLGIEGGISIIGVSGIVKPFSEEAFIESIHKCMVVAKASGTERVVMNSGAKSERFVRALYPDLPPQAFVEYGNYIGATLTMARELGFRKVTLGVMLGKAVKLAEGQTDTHSRKGVMNKDFIGQMLGEAHCAPISMEQVTLARELWKLLPPVQAEAFARVVIGHCLEHCQPLVPEAELTLLLIDDDGTIHSL